MITRNQWLQIVAVVFSACIAASALWTQLFGQNTATIIISLLGLANTILAGVTYVLTGQAQQIKDVAAMPGVDRVSVNAQANTTLAQVATDPAQAKVGATSPEVRSTLVNTARSA